MALMKFDLQKTTAEDVSDIATQANIGKMVPMSKMIAKFATECPPEWGDPGNYETYSKQDFHTVLAVAWKELGAAAKAEEPTVEGVEFDLSKVTPEEFDMLTRDIASTDPKKMAAVMAKFIKKCPKAWGDPSNPETFLKLKYYPQFLPVAKALSKAGNDEFANFIKLLTSD